MATEDEEFEFRARLEREQSQGPRRRTPMEQLARGAGFTARGAIEGTVGLPALALDPIQKRLGMPTLSGATSRLLTKAGLPDKPENFTEKVAQFGGELGGGFGPGALAAGPKIGVALKDVSHDLMASALKAPKKMWRTGDAEEAITTMLEKGFTVTKGSIDKMKGMIDNLNTRVQGEIANSTAHIDKARMGQYFSDLVQKFKNQVNPNADLNAIRRAWQEFQSHPAWGGKATMPVQKAQELKKGTYDRLRDKYGQLGSAETEAQKTGARYLKDEINRVAPQVVPLIREEAELLNALKPTEQALWRELNKNPAGLSLLTHNPLSFGAFLADKSSAFKSLVAKYMYRTSGVTGAAAGGAGTATLEQIGKQLERPDNRQ